MSLLIWPEDFLNKIICGDCLEIMKKFPDKSIDLIEADPPFNFETRARQSDSSFMSKTKKKYIDKINGTFGHAFQPEKYLEDSIRIMKKYNAYWWTSKSLVHRYINFAINHKYSFNILAWHKLNPMPLFHCHYLPDTEYCVFINEKGAFFNSKLENKEKYKKYYLSSIGGDTRNREHPCIKPIFIIKTQIEISSKVNDIVLDPFIGSGSTARAAKDLKRNFIGIEINPDYVKIANERLAQGVL